MSWQPQRFAGTASRGGAGGLGAVPTGAALEGGVRYLVHDRLGSGGMAEVFLGTMATPAGRRPVAIKQVLEEKLRDPEAVGRLVAEAKLGFRLTQANICQVLDLIVKDRGAYLVLEYIDGFDLLKLLELRHQAGLPAIDLATGLFIGREVARGLDFAHRCKGEDGRPLHIVHGDITPPNVLISQEGEVKLADFGIAQALAAGDHLIGGTAGFAAPETQNNDGDHRADIYSLGATLQYALTGRVPIRPGDCSSLGGRGDIPPSTAKLVNRCLAVRPEERFSSAGELEAALSYELARRAPSFTPAVLAKMIVDIKRRMRSEIDLTRTLFAIGDSSNEASVDDHPALAPRLEMVQGSAVAGVEGKPATLTALPRVVGSDRGSGTLTAQPSVAAPGDGSLTLTSSAMAPSPGDNPVTLTAHEQVQHDRTLTAHEQAQHDLTITGQQPVQHDLTLTAQEPVERNSALIAARGETLGEAFATRAPARVERSYATSVPQTSDTGYLNLLAGDVAYTPEAHPSRPIPRPARARRKTDGVHRRGRRRSSGRGISLAAIAAAAATLAVGSYALVSDEFGASTSRVEVAAAPVVTPAGPTPVSAPARVEAAIELEPLPQRSVEDAAEAVEIEAPPAETEAVKTPSATAAEERRAPREKSRARKKRRRAARRASRDRGETVGMSSLIDLPGDSEPAPRRQKGYLSVSSKPWGAVEVDGVRIARETPLFRHTLSAGPHQVVVIYADGTRSRSRSVKIKAGETRSIGFRRDQ